MRYTLKVWQRLGDILLCLPAAKYLHGQGHKVFIACLPKYHDIFNCVDYVTPIGILEAPQFDRGRVLVMGVHPTGGGTEARYNAYRASGRKWQDWVYSQHQELNDCPRGAPVFTKLGHCLRQHYGLPNHFNLAAPFGYSQIQKWKPSAVINAAHLANPYIPVYVLNDAPSKAPGNMICARRLSHLPDIISWADNFATINSASAIISAGLGRPYIHFPQTGSADQDCTGYIAKNVTIMT